MLLLAATLIAMAVTSLAQGGSPNCTLTFTDTQPPQIGPVTTMYNAIMTTFKYAVDCEQCTVTNVPQAVIQVSARDIYLKSILC
jgi:hypothetical protein